MKQIAFIFIFLSIAFSAVAGDYDFSALHGLKGKNGDVWFEISGYDIHVTFQKGKLSDKKKITSLKKKYKIKNIQAEFSDPQLEIPNEIIETQYPWEWNADVKVNAIYYLLQHAENELSILSFQTLNQRDVLLEQAFIKAFCDKTLDEFVSEDWTGEYISFAGRTVQLGNACGWRSPHNFYCKGGQISWSEFPSADAADSDLATRIIANGKKNVQILSTDYIGVLFEDIPTLAKRIVYKQVGSYYPLIVYYISQEVRERYISCVMSTYGYNRNDYELPLLLQNFMSIPNPPDWANNQFDVPDPEPVSAEDKEYMKNSWPSTEIRLGTLVPVGNLSNVYGAAPSVDLFCKIPINQKTSIDFGFLVAVPANRQQFKLSYKDNTDDTKLRMVVGASLRSSYMKTRLNDNWRYNLYSGIGFSSCQTDLAKRINDDGTKDFHSVTTVDIYEGIQLNYKRIGCFLELHYAPYTLSDKVANNFGNKFWNMGLTYTF
ncbi:hypothetical protein AGMMS4957_06410 [Bacteroidia bacterium]|nr:hypothetical protein AGMMS4957_06410 [Bacteroidia bacterium]